MRSNFSTYLQYLLTSKGHVHNALGAAKAKGAPRLVIEALEGGAEGLTVKSAIAGGSTTDATWGGPLEAIRSLSSEWFATLRTVSALDALLPDMQRVPPNQNYGITTATGTGHVVSEAAWKPLTKMAFAAGSLGPQKAMALVAVSQDLVNFGAASGYTLIENELRGAVAAASDVTVVTALLAGLTPLESTGNARTDISAALAAVPLKQTSKPFVLTSPDVVKQLAMLGSSDGPPAFPDVSVPNGGSISGMPLLGLDALADFGDDGTLLLVVDANQIAGDAGALDLTVSNQATLQMSDAPANAASNLVSMFQTDSVAIMGERWFWLQKVRQNAVAAIKGVGYGVGSP